MWGVKFINKYTQPRPCDSDLFCLSYSENSTLIIKVEKFYLSMAKIILGVLAKYCHFGSNIAKI